MRDSAATLTTVAGALDSLARHHASLRTTFDLVPGETPTQVEHAAPLRGTLTVVAPDQVDEALRDPIDHRGGANWQAVLVADEDERPSDLFFVASHLIADGWSMRKLVDDLAPLGDGRPARTPLTSLHSPIELAHEQRGPAWQERREASERYWRTYVQTAPSHQLATAGVGAVASDVAAAVLDLGGPHAGMRDLERQLRVFTSGAVLGLVSHGMLEQSGQDACSFALMTANRGIPPWGDLVVSMNQQIPVVISRRGESRPGDHIVTAQRASFDALQNGCYDVDMADAVMSEHLGRPARSFGPLINYVPTGVRSQAPGGPSGTFVADAPVKDIPTDVYIEVRAGESLQVILYAAKAVLDQAAVTQCLEHAREEFERLARNRLESRPL